MRRLARALLLLVPLLAASACGGGSESAAETLTRAGERTVEAGTARAAFAVEVQATTPVELTGEGVFDFEQQAGRVTMDVGPLLQAFGVPASDGTVEVLTMESLVFIRAPVFNDLLGLATPWLRMDLEQLAEEELGASLGQLGQVTGSDPRQALAILEGASEGGVEALGEEEVRGVATTHYRAAIDVRDAYEQADAVVDPERFEAFLDQLGSDTVDVEAWIDDDGLLRRMTYEVAAAAGAGSARSTIELYDFGTDVDVSPPPAADVTDVTDLA